MRIGRAGSDPRVDGPLGEEPVAVALAGEGVEEDPEFDTPAGMIVADPYVAVLLCGSVRLALESDTLDVTPLAGPVMPVVCWYMLVCG